MAQAWVVQVGSFSQSGNALALRDKLRSNGFTAFVEKLKTAEGTVYRVRVGPELKRENAEKQLKQLQLQMNLKGIVMEHQG
jgi:DedD protein